MLISSSNIAHLLESSLVLHHLDAAAEAVAVVVVVVVGVVMVVVAVS